MQNEELANLMAEYNPLHVELKLETRLYHDLNIWGDDAEEFLQEYSRRFSVSLSSFDIEKYFPSEGDPFLMSIFRALTGRKAKEYIGLTVGDLEQAIISKSLR